MITANTQEQHILSCRNLSLFSTINGVNSWSRILSPPPVAQFIKEINLKAFSGEIYGFIGAPGSGKSTLLEAVSCRGNGDVTGSLQFNHNLLTRERFNELGSFVHPSHSLLPVLSVRSLLYYTARLHLGGLTTISDIHKRISKVVAEFEILQYSQKRPIQLSKSATRRLMVALAIVKDPLLLVLDDILDELDSLSSYHLLTCLSSFVKKNNRIVLLSLRNPRSDLYHLLDRVTILFYGETFYSGKTKDLPAYFQNFGFPCPASENPAMYYLTLSTIDRETPERFSETQEQAVSLVNKFKEMDQSMPLEELHVNRQSYGIGSTIALCYLEKPGLSTKFLVILRRNIEIICNSPITLASSILLAPIISLIISFFVSDFSSTSRTVPHSVNGFFSTSLYIFCCISCLNLYILYSPILVLSFKEYWEGIANQAMSLLSFLTISFPVLLFSSFTSAFILLWRVHLFHWLDSIILGSLLLSSALFTQAISLSLFLITREGIVPISSSLTLITFLFSISGQLIRSMPSLSNSWLDLVTVINPFSYTGYLLSSTLISPLKVSNCTRTNRLDVDPSPPHIFCRWKSGLEAHNERYPEGYEMDTSIIYLLLILSVLYLILFLLHFVRKPGFLVKRFL